MIYLGSHVSLKGEEMFYGSVKEAISYGANAMMVYTGAPQNTLRKPINVMKISEGLKLMEEHNIKPANLVIHAPYIMNLANPSEEKRNFGIDFLTSEIERSEQMQATQIVFHPGNAVGSTREQAIIWIAEGLNKVINRTKGSKVRIALETMAGKGTEIGKTFEELRDIINLINDKSRVSVCFDTCHTHDAGYDIKEDFDSVIKEFDKIVGIDKISVLHINDSKNVKGAAKDRHENIGFGEIGFESLQKIIYHKDFLGIPKILETPYVNQNAPYKEEIVMLKENKFNPNLKEELASK